MTKTRLLLAVACAVSLAAARVPAAGAEDLTLVFKTTSKDGASTSTSYFSSEKMRTGDAERDTIIEYGPGKITSIDHKKKEYSEITLAEMEAAMQKAKAQLAQMEEQMKNMPPAVKEKMESMMGGGGAVTVTKGGTRQVAGYSCQDYTVAAGQMMTTKLCTTTALALPIPNADFSKYSSFATTAGMMASNPMFKGMQKFADEMKKIEGVAIAEATSVKVMGRGIDTAKEATEIKKGAIPASAFDLATIAKGYKKVPNPVTQMK